MSRLSLKSQTDIGSKWLKSYVRSNTKHLLAFRLLALNGSPVVMDRLRVRFVGGERKERNQY
ncbi:MAG: hypothetical protein ABL864_05850 [Terricaulis sp.]